MGNDHLPRQARDTRIGKSQKRGRLYSHGWEVGGQRAGRHPNLVLAKPHRLYNHHLHPAAEKIHHGGGRTRYKDGRCPRFIKKRYNGLPRQAQEKT